jgi:alkyldihydroxyacetonephosphate synthase
MTKHRLKVFGWGRENEAMTPDEEAFALRTYQTLFGVSTFETVPVPTLDALALRNPRLTPPTPLAGICTAALRDRAAHTFGKSYQDTMLQLGCWRRDRAAGAQRDTGDARSQCDG